MTRGPGQLALAPHGRALLAYHRGDKTAVLLVRRDDGLEIVLPVSHFFRSPAEYSTLERMAVERCVGRVLDIGAGTGLHSLELLARDREVTAIDLSPEAVDVMIDRGVPDARCADVMRFHDGPYDTLLMLGHGIGAVGDMEGLGRFLVHARRLTSPAGQLLVDSLDVRATDDPRHLAYHASNRAAGRYSGETRLQFEFEALTGPWCDWLHVDSVTLREQGEQTGWDVAVLHEEAGGDYLARLTWKERGGELSGIRRRGGGPHRPAGRGRREKKR